MNFLPWEADNHQAHEQLCVCSRFGTGCRRTPAATRPQCRSRFHRRGSVSPQREGCGWRLGRPRRFDIEILISTGRCKAACPADWPPRRLAASRRRAYLALLRAAHVHIKSISLRGSLSGSFSFPPTCCLPHTSFPPPPLPTNPYIFTEETKDILQTVSQGGAGGYRREHCPAALLAGMSHPAVSAAQRVSFLLLALISPNTREVPESAERTHQQAQAPYSIG